VDLLENADAFALLSAIRFGNKDCLLVLLAVLLKAIFFFGTRRDCEIEGRRHELVLFLGDELREFEDIPEHVLVAQ